MDTIKEVITKYLALGEKLMEEHPGLASVSFEASGYSVDEVRQAAKELGENEPQYLPGSGRFSFLVSPPLSSIYIHIYSAKVKVRELIISEDDIPM